MNGGQLADRDGSIALVIAHDALDVIARDMRRPAFRAGAAVTIAATIILARLGARPSLVIVSAVLLGAAAENLYGMAEAIAASSAEAAAVPAGVAAAVRDLIGARDADPAG